MIDAKHEVNIDRGISDVWDFVKDIERWALLFPGCKSCEVLDENRSLWVLKVGAGGMIKTVNVQVNVENWSGPERVDFVFELESEPVTGKGYYLAAAAGESSTAVEMYLQVAGSGQMAGMWEAMSKPLLPQMAKAFAQSLKEEIEALHGIETQPETGLTARLWRWIFNLFGLGKAKNSTSKTA